MSTLNESCVTICTIGEVGRGQAVSNRKAQQSAADLEEGEHDFEFGRDICARAPADSRLLALHSPLLALQRNLARLVHILLIEACKTEREREQIASEFEH